MIKKAGITLLLLTALVALGFLREFIFVNTNSILYTKFYTADRPIPSFFHFFESKSYWFVYTCKWIFTVLFIAAYYFLQLATAKWLLKGTAIRKWLFLFYVFLVILSGITFAVGWLSGSLYQGYRFSRVFLGILQSPLPIMFLIPVHYFARKINQQPDSYRN